MRRIRQLSVTLAAAGLLAACTSRTDLLEENLLAMGKAFRHYQETLPRERSPLVAQTPGVLFFRVEGFMPAFLDDPTRLVSPRHPRARALRQRASAAWEANGAMDADELEWIGAESFYYLAHAFVDEEGGLKYAAAYRAHAADGPPFMHEDIRDAEADSSRPRVQLWQVRTMVERHFMPDRPPLRGPMPFPDIPVLIERPHRTGQSVLVLTNGGKVHTVPHGEFPNTAALLDALEGLRDMR